MFFHVLALLFLGVFAACSSSKKSAVTPVAKTGSISGTDSLAGLAIIKTSDCYTCHSVSEKLVAPSFISIAQRYDSSAATIDKLVIKIMKGGYGSWSNIPMTPHPSLSAENAETAVKYILSLKK